MSDIWHEPTETPTEHKTLLFDSIEFGETEMGVYSGGLFHSYNEFEPMTPAGLSRWAYLSDFINCQKELIRTRKALDVAVDALKEIDETRSYSKEPLQAINNRILNAGVCFCWTLPDNIHRALWKINNIDKGE